MKNSKRNIANANARAERLAAGKPPVSKFERKRLSEEEIHARLNPPSKAKGGVVAS